MAKDPTQGPVSTHDAEGNPITTNVDAPIEEVAVEEAEEETAADESDVEETEEEVAEVIATPPDLPEDYVGGTEPVEPDVEEAEEEAAAEEVPESEDVVTAEIEDTTEPEEEAPIEDVDYSELEGSAEPDEKAPEDGVAPMEDLWERLTEVGAESGPDTGVVRHVEFTCDRCDETKEGMLFAGGWAGFYAIDSYPDNLSNKDFGWSKYANDGEEIICDACMQSDERYLADYPAPSEEVEAADEEIERAEVGDETEKKPKEEDAPVEEEEEFVTHEHEVKPPLTYNEAETMLMGTSFLKIREMAIADGIKPERSRVKVTRQLLEYWFPAPTSPPADDEPEMSVRIRRAKGLM